MERRGEQSRRRFQRGTGEAKKRRAGPGRSSCRSLFRRCEAQPSNQPGKGGGGGGGIRTEGKDVTDSWSKLNRRSERLVLKALVTG